MEKYLLLHASQGQQSHTRCVKLVSRQVALSDSVNTKGKYLTVSRENKN